MSTTQAPEPTSYVVEGDSYRKLIAERDAYKRIANDLARQLRERTPADTNAPPERAAQETRPAPEASIVKAFERSPRRVDIQHSAAHDCACRDCVAAETAVDRCRCGLPKNEHPDGTSRECYALNRGVNT